MKTSIAILLSATLSSQAALVYFDISPAGSDAAVGLSPANVVPPVTNSTGSGDSISGGVYFDTETSLLHFAMGYGSAAGFADLTGPATGISINGAAPPGAWQPPLFALTDRNFPALDPAKGGVIYGSVFYPDDPVENPVTNLLAGLHFILIRTVANPDGELRGQLVPTQPKNLAPVVTCPNPATVECGSRATVSVLPAGHEDGDKNDHDGGWDDGHRDQNSTKVTVLVTDPEGDAMTVLWTLNGMPVQTNGVPATNPPAMTKVTFRGVLPLGTNVVQVIVTDSATNTAWCSTIITVVDTKPPVIDSSRAQPNTLWPPNHKMVPVTVSARVGDMCGAAAWKIIDVRSNEPENGLGDGDTAPDWTITGNHTVSLRAERSGKGSGRVYTITIQAKDQSGNLSEPKTVTVSVPKSQGNNGDKGDKGGKGRKD